MNKLGFTFIEIIVVISIISIISLTGSFYFIDFVKNKELQNEAKIITQTIQDLNQKTKQYKIFDYHLHISQGDQHFVVSENNDDSSYLQSISLENGTYTLTSDYSGNNLWIIQPFVKHKKQDNIIKTGNQSYTGSIVDNNTLKFNGEIGGEKINTLYLQFYSQNYFETENNTITVSQILDKNNISIGNKLIIKNTQGNIGYYDKNDTALELPLFIELEKNGHTTTLEIK